MSAAELFDVLVSLRRAEIKVRIRINALPSDLEGPGLSAMKVAEDAWLELKRAAEAMHHAIKRTENGIPAGKVVSLAGARGRKEGSRRKA